jgi:hypothetical protein
MPSASRLHFATASPRELPTHEPYEHLLPFLPIADTPKRDFSSLTSRPHPFKYLIICYL